MARNNGYNEAVPILKVSVAKARDTLTKLIQAVESGEQVTICRHGKPVVDLVPTKANQRQERRFGTLKGLASVKDPNWSKAVETSDELEAWLQGDL